MGLRNISEYLASGEADNIVLAGNIGYLAIQDPAYNGMFMRVENGVTGLYRAPDQDLHWEDVDNTQRTLDTVDTQILSITTDAELNANNGSYTISCRLDNTSNQAREVTIHVEVDGVPSSDAVYLLDKNEINKSILVSGAIDGTIASGAVINVWFDCSGAGVELRGDVLETKFTVTAAQSAPVVMSAAVLDSFDWNELPAGDPHEWGRLYTHTNNTIRVSQG